MGKELAKLIPVTSRMITEITPRLEDIFAGSLWRSELTTAYPMASARTINALMRARLRAWDVDGLTDYGLLQIPGIGPVAVREIRSDERPT